MDVKFSDTFFDSLQRMIKHDRWYWKVYYAITKDIPRFVKAAWKHRMNAWNAFPWESGSSLRFMKTHLEEVAIYLEKYGHEVEDSRNKKIEKIRRAIELIDHYLEDSYIELAEKQLGKEVTTKLNFVPVGNGLYEMEDADTEQEKLDNSEIFDLARKLEIDEWMELFAILRGQDFTLFDKAKETDPNINWNDWFDGSGMNTWWD